MIALFIDDPDTTVDPQDAVSHHTLIGLPVPTRLPAEYPGAKYRRLYPPKLDQPLEITIYWNDGEDRSLNQVRP